MNHDIKMTKHAAVKPPIRPDQQTVTKVTHWTDHLFFSGSHGLLHSGFVQVNLS
jgi:hypothetical protein